MIVLGIVTMAALFLATRAWRAFRASRKAASGCGSDCGCGH
jgi:hypothetical protein